MLNLIIPSTAIFQVIDNQAYGRVGDRRLIPLIRKLHTREQHPLLCISREGRNIYIQSGRNIRCFGENTNRLGKTFPREWEHHQKRRNPKESTSFHIYISISLKD